MRLTTVGIPATRHFCATKADLKQAFGDIQPLSVHMGSLGNKYQFDSRCHHRPHLVGPVVASLSVSRELTAIFQAYPVEVESYSAEVVVQFREEVLPRMRLWLLTQLGKPQTAILGHEQLIIEWSGSAHREHAIRFM